MCEARVGMAGQETTPGDEAIQIEFNKLCEAAAQALLELKTSCHESFVVLPEYEVRSIAYNIAHRVFQACHQDRF